MEEQADLIELTVRIVEAHAQGTEVDLKQIPDLIRETYAALAKLVKSDPGAIEANLEPAVSIRKSRASREHLISLIDGKKYKTLKRHLAIHGYTPETYRETFGLPRDYPMTAPAYSERRAAMAKEIGLGRKAAKERGLTKKSASSG